MFVERMRQERQPVAAMQREAKEKQTIMTAHTADKRAGTQREEGKDEQAQT